MRAVPLVVAVGILAMLAGCASKAEPPLPLPNLSDDPALRQQLDGYAESIRYSYPGISLPDVPIERLIASGDWATTIAGCLGEAGFRASVSDGGISATGVTPEDMKAYDLASYVCKARFPVESEYTRVDDVQLELLYAYYVGPLSECLAGFGVAVDPEPGLTTFIETYGSAETWDPYRNVADLPAQTMNDVIPACPQRPETEEEQG